MESAKELYEKAYELHYKKKNLALAYKVYKEIIENYPDENESKYSKSQMANIDNIPGFDATLIDSYTEDTFVHKSDYFIMHENKENMLVSSGYNFDGYDIIKYIKFISSEVVLGMGIFRGLCATISNITGMESNVLKDKLIEAKSIVNDEILNQAVNLGANAIIGVDLDYTMFGGELLGVVMSGTAVIVEKRPTQIL